MYSRELFSQVFVCAFERLECFFSIHSSSSRLPPWTRSLNDPRQLRSSRFPCPDHGMRPIPDFHTRGAEAREQWTWGSGPEMPLTPPRIHASGRARWPETWSSARGRNGTARCFSSVRFGNRTSNGAHRTSVCSPRRPWATRVLWRGIISGRDGSKPSYTTRSRDHEDGRCFTTRSCKWTRCISHPEAPTHRGISPVNYTLQQFSLIQFICTALFSLFQQQPLKGKDNRPIIRFIITDKLPK